jgi:hypothetical protein
MVLYNFNSQADDEVSVAAGDEVTIIDDTKSEYWWQVRRIKNGKQGRVPSCYVEISGGVSKPGTPGTNAVRSTAGQNRLEEPWPSRTLSTPELDLSKVRTWTDRSKTCTVEAQFLALKNGNIQLHKMNGVKVAVPVDKMSVEDLEYVEQITRVLKG